MWVRLELPSIDGPIRGFTFPRKDVFFVGSSALRCELLGIQGFRACRDFLSLTPGMSAAWGEWSEEVLARDGYGHHHH